MITLTDFSNELWFGFSLAKTDDEGDFLQIVSYKDITDVTYSDFERMENYYDCSCKVIKRIRGQLYKFDFSFLK